MKKIEYAMMADRENEYWWHIGRLRILQTYIKAATSKSKRPLILNIGCGTGGTIDMLDKFGLTDNVDVSSEAIRFMKEHGYRRLYKVQGIDLPFEDNKYDLICAFDVLEHISKESAALKEWRRVLKPGGALVISVPAYKWLWSDHDVSLHHKRRYTKKRLSLAAKKAKLKVVRKSYAIVFSLPLIAGFRLINNALGRKSDAETSYVDVPATVNSFFVRLLYIEASLHKVISFPAGTSVVAILKKAD